VIGVTNSSDLRSNTNEKDTRNFTLGRRFVGFGGHSGASRSGQFTRDDACQEASPPQEPPQESQEARQGVSALRFWITVVIYYLRKAPLAKPRGFLLTGPVYEKGIRLH
jgi:hypothetical protein